MKGWGGKFEPLQLSSQPPNTMPNYVQGGLARPICYTYDLQHDFGRSPTVEKFNPQLIFHNSNTGWGLAVSLPLNYPSNSEV